MGSFYSGNVSEDKFRPIFEDAVAQIEEDLIEVKAQVVIAGAEADRAKSYADITESKLAEVLQAADVVNSDKLIVQGLRDEVAQDRNTVATDKGIVESAKDVVVVIGQDVTAKHADVVTKHGEVLQAAQQVSEDKTIVESDKGIVSNLKDETQALHDQSVEARDVAVKAAEDALYNANLTFISGGLWNPTGAEEYPDVSSVTRDTIYIVNLPHNIEVYTFKGGDLAGNDVKSGFYMFYDTPSNKWSDIDTSITGIISINGKTDTHVVLTPEDIGTYPKATIDSKDATVLQSAKDFTYDKATIDQKVSEAGKVKTVNAKQPDVNGNVQISADDVEAIPVDGDIIKNGKLTVNGIIETNQPFEYKSGTGIGCRLVSDHEYGYIQAGSYSGGNQKMVLSGISGKQLTEVRINNTPNSVINNVGGYYQSAALLAGGYVDHHSSAAPYFYVKSTTSGSEYHAICKGKVLKSGQASGEWSFGTLVEPDGASKGVICGSRGSSDTKQWYFDYTSGDFIAPGNVTGYSDKRVKTDVKHIDNALDKVCQLNGYTYLRTDTDDNKRQAGVIAQELEKVLPEAVTTIENGDIKDFKTVAYGNIVPLLIEAIKEQTAQLKEQQTQIDELKALIKK